MIIGLKYVYVIRTKLILWLLIWTIQPVFSQQYNFKNYTVKDGIAQSQVYSLLQDSRGYIWMGTRGGGLTRYDGLQFTTFNQRNGLNNNYVYCIKEHPDGTLWIATNEGISSYNGLTFQNFVIDANQSVFVQDFQLDGNRIWLATSIGLFLFENGKFRNIHSELNQKSEIVNSVLVVDKKLYFGTGNGLFLLEDKHQLKELNSLKNKHKVLGNAITKIRKDKQGKIWIGTYGDGLYCLNKTACYRIDLHHELKAQTILDIYEDTDENIWFATLNKGVGAFYKKEKVIRFLSEKEGLTNNHVRSICQDNAHNFWFGTSGGGVSHYFGKQFSHYDQTAGLAGNFVYSVYRDSQKQLWLGNASKGVSKLSNDRFVQFGAENGFIDTKVKAIGEASNGWILFGTDGQGLYAFDGDSFQLVPGMDRKYIRTIRTDSEGSTWVATAGHGIYCLKWDGVQFQLKNHTVSSGLLENRILDLHIDKMGRIWYASESQGIGYIYKDKAQRDYIRKKQGLPSHAIRSLCEDQDGNLWIGTAGNGLAFFPLYSKKRNIETISIQDGLNSNNIYLITCDSKNHILAGSETGLDHLFLNENRQIIQIRHYSKGDGFTGIETCQNAVFSDTDGTYWFGTINGLSHFNPANTLVNLREPVTRITDVKLFYESLSKTRFKNHVKDWNKITYLILPYDQNHIGFDFLGINLSNPDAVHYQWMLEGFDANWSPISMEKSIVYTNLNPGKYTFLVRARNEDGVWNKIPSRFSFEITSPFWQKWWFYLLLILIIIVFIGFIFRFRLSRIQRKAKELQEKTELEKEVLELEQKALRLQMNPHFIFNALNSIQSLIGTGKEQEARYYLAKFARLMRQILDNSRKTSITLEQEIQSIENYLLIEKFCQGDCFDYEIQIDPALDIDYINIPPMLLQPLLENAIKHGITPMLVQNTSRRGKIDVSFSLTEHTLVCTVVDNGIGRKKASELHQAGKEKYHQSTAQLVIEERLALLDASTISYEDLEENNEALGTKVVITIPIQ